jgi:hypothetical protein
MLKTADRPERRGGDGRINLIVRAGAHRPRENTALSCFMAVSMTPKSGAMPKSAAVRRIQMVSQTRLLQWQ